MPDYPALPLLLLDALHSGLVIPAHPLALDDDGHFDELSQRALTRYYHAAGAGGIAVAVHTTQFAIRDPRHGLLEPVLELAATTARACDAQNGRRTLLVAGICGKTEQALREARLASDHGYDIGLISLGAMAAADDDLLIRHCRAVAEVMPIMGFYLQSAVGGRTLGRAFWRELSRIPNLSAIKIAPFDRYATIDLLRGVADSGRAHEIALYTGNDDSIVNDLLTRYAIESDGEIHELSMAGGLLGHWASWTTRAVPLLARCRQARESASIPSELLTHAAAVTESNAAIFDPLHRFAGCIPGIHEVLLRQGLIRSRRTLDPDERLSPGQIEEIDRVYRVWPELTDDEFVRENLDRFRG
jgi:dihydrodipicolinate synthase/N-acetylneuraminate lyase